LGIEVDEASLTEFGHFSAPAAGQEHRVVNMSCFVVTHWVGTPTASSEIEALAYVDSASTDIELGSIVAHELIPRLRDAGQIV
jgi:hypothetical protein